MAHYAQLIDTRSLDMYDFGEAGNMKRYHRKTPPHYNLTLIPPSVPIALFTGGADYLADPTDVLRLVATMGPARFAFMQDISYANHMYFVWSLEVRPILFADLFLNYSFISLWQAKKTIYPKVIDLLTKYGE